MGAIIAANDRLSYAYRAARLAASVPPELDDPSAVALGGTALGVLSSRCHRPGMVLRVTFYHNPAKNGLQ